MYLNEKWYDKKTCTKEEEINGQKMGLSMVLFIMATFIFTPKIFANEVDYTYIMEEVEK